MGKPTDDLYRRLERDAWHEHDGRLTINGFAIAMRGRCHCGCPLYTAAEAETGACVDHGGVA